MALVNTNHPSRIPLAYKYREGDYSTQVQVHILTCREWTPDQYPPPEDQQNQYGAHPAPSGPCHGSDPANAAENSSSSSSNGGLSEPTIDLSCWSPRSNRFKSIDAKKHWQKIRKPIEMEQRTSPLQTPLTGADDRPIQILLSQGRRQAVATVDPSTLKDLIRTHLSKRVSVSVPNHVAVSIFRLLATLLPDTNASSKPPSAPPTLLLSSYRTPQLYHKWDLTSEVREARETKLLKENINPTKPPSSVGLNHTAQKRIADQAHIPFLALAQTDNIATFPSRAHSQHRPCILLTIDLSHTPLLHHPVLGHNSYTGPHTPELTCSASSPPAHHAPDRSSWPQPNRTLLISGPHKIASQTSSLIPDFQRDNIDPQSSPDRVTQTRTQVLPSPTKASLKTKNKRKGKQMATRRSPRIQAKQTTSSQLKQPREAKSRANALSFDLDKYDAPIDATKTIAILQASGLKINEQVQQMVDAAAQKDKIEGNPDEDTPPTTPLHDHIPPLAVHGQDLLL